MSSMVWNIGLNSSVKAVKSSIVFNFSRYLRNGFKYLTVSLASKHAVLTSFSNLQHRQCAEKAGAASNLLGEQSTVLRLVKCSQAIPVESWIICALDQLKNLGHFLHPLT